VGLDQNDAHILLGKHQLLHLSRAVPINRTTGVVFAQATPAGTRVAAGTRLKLCWAGPTEVPDVVHLTQARAVQRLVAAGYRPVDQQAETEQTVLVGKVTTQNPPAGARADSGATVAISIGVLAKVEVPSVVNLTRSAAERRLRAKHLWARVSGSTSDSAVVRSQSPLPHARVDAWSRVDVAMVMPAPPPKPAPPQPTLARPEPQPSTPWTGWLWKVLLAVSGLSAVGGLAREYRLRRRVHALQVVVVRDLGSPKLAVPPQDADAELRNLGLELRPIVDPGTQRVVPESIIAGKERTGV
jgi:beta-lactam-binding protein with PASTA domain